MIPLTKDDKLVVEDKKSQVKYFVRAVTGENEDAYLDLVDKFSPEMSNKERLPALNALFDFFVLGWEATAPDVKIRPFPSDGQPHRFFNYRFKNWLANAAFDVNELGLDETKN